MSGRVNVKVQYCQHWEQWLNSNLFVTLPDTVAGHGAPVSLEASLRTVAPDRLRLETARFLGATARVAARLRAVRRPAAGVNARRRMARKNAKHKGAPPSPAHLTLRAWHLLMTHVPATI